MRRLPPVVKWKEELVDKATKDKPIAEDVSLPSFSASDSSERLLEVGKAMIALTLRCVGNELKATMGLTVPSRDCLMALKDSMAILQELNKKEKEDLENLTDEDLEKIAKGEK